MEVQINYLAVVAAMFSSLVVGSIWYAQAVFGKTWIKLAKIDMSRKRGSVFAPIVTTMIVSLVTAFVLAYLAYLSNWFFQNSFLQDTLTTAFWVWLGLVAARFITHDAFEGRRRKLTLLNIGNEFVTIMVMGLVIGVIGV